MKELLREYPEIEIVQIQFNYADYDSNIIESRKLYEICKEFKKPFLSMESIKGGSLANLPDDAKDVFDELNIRQGTNFTPAEYALRWVAALIVLKLSFPG